MDVVRYGFLKAILGEDGAQALAKAAERSPVLAPVLVPRAILSWLNLLGNAPEFEGQLPGVENTYVSFSKAENGYTGTIAVGDTSYGFEAATAMHLAASIGVALGVDAEALDPQLRDLDLQRLGKSVDLLVKARAAAEFMAKRQLDPALGYTFTHQHHDWEPGKIGWTRVEAHAPTGEKVGDVLFTHTKEGAIQPSTSVVEEAHQRRGVASAMYAHGEKVTGKKVVPGKLQTDEGSALWAGNAKAPQFGTQKAEAAGPAAAPQKQGAPVEPVAPQKQPKLPTPRAKGPSVKLTMAEASQVCPVCAQPQFHGERLVGCLCFQDLAKATRTERTLEGFTLHFGPEWDPEALDVFLEGFRARSRR